MAEGSRWEEQGGEGKGQVSTGLWVGMGNTPVMIP